MTSGSEAQDTRAPASALGGVFQVQILMTGVMTLILCVSLAVPGGRGLDSASFFFGSLLILGATMVVGLIPWAKLPSRVQILVPLVDILGIALLRVAVPDSGFGVVMAFPVIWLATSFGRTGVVAGPAFAALLVWGHTLARPFDLVPAPTASQNPTTATGLTLTLAFIAGVTYVGNRRLEAQRVLLRRQTRLLEDALERARVGERTLREVFDAVDFSVIGLDSDGNTLMTNRETSRLVKQLGLPAGSGIERIPAYRRDRTTPLTHDELPHVRALRGEVVEDSIMWLGHRGDPRVAVSTSVGLIRDSAGEITRVVLAARNVTAELEAISARDDLVTSMSHELRTPLSSILGYVELALEDETLTPGPRGMLDVALSNTERLMALVSDLLSARSTSPSGTITITPAPCDLAALVGESVESIRPLAVDRLVTLAVDVEPDLVIEGDAFRLRQVVDNLLSNAVKYNQYGGRITVTMRSVPSPGGGSAELSVADTGRGMTHEEQKGLFQRFYRAESVRGSTVHGTGLGLSISRDIVLLHGGTIDVSSEPGTGTTVHVRLPLPAPAGALP